MEKCRRGGGGGVCISGWEDSGAAKPPIDTYAAATEASGRGRQLYRASMRQQVQEVMSASLRRRTGPSERGGSPAHEHHPPPTDLRRGQGWGQDCCGL
eukprot:CAMPEP_0174326500 /NCGR_PEP_ID=MMETSP0810-20121108/13946_1 /TAXON_ID=73025 ORGANISM="Eutreptiella gymnastica-like, Strain CCMP1594" /NCGR_SAMPLE_ID=MMETSP0810 /ASSEMBLY_ACC=CAM_ASM_000659 /LENGTH=97 /DNA_ID=CAMNT_0015440143 /DNA_START=245 /DNA_END=538 /DNA_ORIENTATION=+